MTWKRPARWRIGDSDPRPAWWVNAVMRAPLLQQGKASRPAIRPAIGTSHVGRPRHRHASPSASSPPALLATGTPYLRDVSPAAPLTATTSYRRHRFPLSRIITVTTHVRTTHLCHVSPPRQHPARADRAPDLSNQLPPRPRRTRTTDPWTTSVSPLARSASAPASRKPRHPAPATPSASCCPTASASFTSRWSGEACWIPLGDFDFGLPYENATSHPSPGQILLHPGSVSETEILLGYGACCFASKVGQLAGNHFLTVVEGNENLMNLGKLVLWSGAQDIVFAAE